MKQGSGVAEAAASLPDYLGHRERLRDRFRHHPDDLQDYELLELVLFRMVPRADTKPIAKALLQQFKTFTQILAAAPERLMDVDGVGPAIAQELKIFEAVAQRCAREQITGRDLLGSLQSVVDYCHTRSSFKDREEVRVIFLDKKNRLLAEEQMGLGTIDHAPLYPREVIRRALELGAAGLILVHNHPSGDPTPSADDIRITLEIHALATAMSIAVHDHLIIGHKKHASLKKLGYFNPS